MRMRNISKREEYKYLDEDACQGTYSNDRRAKMKIKPINPVARQLREPRFKKQVIKSKKHYTRKGRSIRPFHIKKHLLVKQILL